MQEFKVIPMPTIELVRNEKGDFLGECYRTSCKNTEARWFNHSTQKHYCPECAFILNRENRRDAINLFGHDLCTLKLNNDATL